MDSIQHRPPNANQEVSNTNHSGSVSESALAATSEYMNIKVCQAIISSYSTGANSHRRPNKENRSTYLTEKV